MFSYCVTDRVPFLCRLETTYVINNLVKLKGMLLCKSGFGLYVSICITGQEVSGVVGSFLPTPSVTVTD